MPEQLWLTALLNKYFAGVANAILGCFHLQHPSAGARLQTTWPCSSWFSCCWCLFFVIVRARLSVDDPGAMQH